MLKSYANNAFGKVHAINSFACYTFPIRGLFQAMSVLMRYDSMSDHSDGLLWDEETKSLGISDYGRHRLTGGVTFSFAKKFVADIRINYEQYFYKNNAVPKESEQNKLVIEFMTRF